MKECTVPGCGRVEYLAHGFCDMHYKRWRKHGDPLRERKTSPEVRFWRKVRRGGADDCWLWSGATIRGYGAFNSGDGRVVYTHRFAYEVARGRIGAGLQLDHLCRTPLCVNPAHLEPVTPAENSRRANKIGHHPSAPATCRRGHDWIIHPPLLAHRSDGRVTRQCRVCAELRGAA